MSLTGAPPAEVATGSILPQWKNHFSNWIQTSKRSVIWKKSISSSIKNMLMIRMVPYLSWKKSLNSTVPRIFLCSEKLPQLLNLINGQSSILSVTRYIRDEKYGRKTDMLRRISNGPMEGFNVNPKSLKRNSHGVSNFIYNRNRILWATRNNPSILAIPRSKEEIHNHTGKKRGPYKKSK